MFNTLTIVAPGLLGTSLAMAASQKALAKNVVVYARRDEAVRALADQPWCQKATTDLSEACGDAELIVLCAPVNRIISLSEELAPQLSKNPIVTDVGSVKGDIVRHCQYALARKARFVGSHPMAGSEKQGMDNARSDLFEGRICFVTPDANTSPEASDQVCAFWRKLGSTVVQESPDKHDEIVAQVSHLPHILASSLASFLLQTCPDARDYCGNGLKDTTRVASGDPALWREIIGQNRQEIIRSIKSFQDHLQAIGSAIANENDLELLQRLADGKSFRDNL